MCLQFIINNQEYCKYPLILTETENDGMYTELFYPFTTGANVEYIAICVNVLRSLDYLSIYVYSSKGMTPSDDTMTAVRTIDYNTRYYVDMSQFYLGYLPEGFWLLFQN